MSDETKDTTREALLDAVAELDAKLDRKLESVTKRLNALEGRRSLFAGLMDDPERMMLVLGVLYLASMVVPPLVAAMQKKETVQ